MAHRRAPFAWALRPAARQRLERRYDALIAVLAAGSAGAAKFITGADMRIAVICTPGSANVLPNGS